MNRLFVVVILCFNLASCTEPNKRLTLLHSAEVPAPEIAEKIKQALDKEGFTIELSSEALNPERILEMLATGEADLAVTEEPEGMQPGVTTITPLYPSILHVMYLRDENPTSFKEVLTGKQVYAGPPGGAARRLLKSFSQDFRVPESSYTVHDDPWTVTPEVFFILGDFLAPDSVDRLSDYRLYSFGSPSALGQGTVAEGLALTHPNIKTFVLPKGIYGPFNEQPILTLATRSVLLASETLEEAVGYELIQRLIEHSQELSDRYSLVTQELKPDLDATRLTQPLHLGARRFVDRDKPGFIERYVEVIALAITILAALGSGMLGLYRYSKQRKKDRVDVYYRKILDLRQKIRTDMDIDALRAIATEVKDTQEEVFALLIDERVSADETLTIFLDLSNQVLKELEPKLG
ncbi:MAG: TAXI family TRAP transporter solute-binding subunit [Pseudomonadota bacterium]